MEDLVESLSARAAALRLLEAALAGRRGLEGALAATEFRRLPARDRAFARALVMMTLRRLGPIDRALDARLSREPPRPVRDILRLGAAQAWFMGTPDFAAVSTSVDLATRNFQGLVNAVMRGLVRNGPPASNAEDLAPNWLLARWRAAYGPEAALRIAAQIGAEPQADLTPRSPPDARLIESLEAHAMPGGTLRTGRRGDPAAWPGYAEGNWWVQDAAAAIPARLLAVRRGEAVLDLCAAPGGKTLQLAAAGARVTALDRSAGRLRRVATGLKRTGLAAELVAADVLAWSDGRRFDAVLLDSPCSGTGTFRRHPDVLWNVRPGDIAALAGVQSQLLAAAASRVRIGGRLIYSVCSLEAEEGEAQVGEFLRARPDFELCAIEAGEGGAPEESLATGGWLRILPFHRDGGLDGFFIARFLRN
jgi:16S rRNA (cytosine967-C5)-methyltransferase